MLGGDYESDDDGRTAFFNKAGFVVFSVDSTEEVGFEQQMEHFVKPSSSSSQVSHVGNSNCPENEGTSMNVTNWTSNMTNVTNFPNFTTEHPLIRSKLETLLHYVHTHFNSTLKDKQLVYVLSILHSP